MKRGLIYLFTLFSVIILLGVGGCLDTETTVPTTSTDTGNTISNNASVGFVGKVVDPLGNPMSGVSVELISDTKQTASTDVNGNWLINVDLGKIVATPGGGTWGDSDDTIENNSDEITRNFPIEISKSGFGTYRYEAHFHATIGYTDGTGAVVLLSKLGTVQPTTVLHPYVDNFQFTVYAGANTAPGAVVTLWRCGPEWTDPPSPGINQGSTPGSRYEVDEYRYVADSSGVIKVTKAEKLPADGIYLVFAAPYDVLVEDTDDDGIYDTGDGIYEYDSSIATQPAGGFNLNVQDVLNAASLIHYEYDSTTGDFEITQTENAPSVLLQDALSDIVVTYLSIDNVQNIPIAEAEDFTIIVMFNRPVTEQTLAAIGGPLFTLTGINGNVGIPYTTTNTGNYLYTITPDETLTPSYNRYTFTINNNLLGASGGFNNGFAQNFSIYDPAATMFASITPGVDINDNTSYKVDWDDIYLGLPYADAAMIPDLNMSWAVSAGATGYEVWVKDSNTPWQRITPVNWTYNDGQYIEANISLGASGGLFDAFDPGNAFGLNALEPFFGGNEVQVVVMPQNANGFAIDPNTIDPADETFIPLRLADNWGPEIRTDDGWNPADDDTGFDANTRYDDTEVNIQVDEPLQDATLTGEYGTDEYGARAVTGSYFTVADAYWPDLDLALDAEGAGTAYPSNRGYILVDLSPTVTTTLTAAADAAEDVISVTVADMDNFAIDDLLVVNGEDEGDITGFNVTAGTFTLSAGLTADVAEDDAAYWRGPIKPGYASVTGTLIGASNTYDLRLYVASLTNIGAGDSIVTVPAGAAGVGATQVAVDPVPAYITITNAPTNALPSESTVSGLSWSIAAGDLTGVDDDNADTDNIARTVMTAAVAGGATTINVTHSDDMAIGDVITLHRGSGVQENVTVVTVPNATSFTCTATINAHAIGHNVEERISFSTTLAIGYPLIGVSTVAKMKPNSEITITDTVETDAATVIEASENLGGVGPAVVIDAILVDSAAARYTFAHGSTFTNDSSRNPDALQVNLIDRSDNDSGDTDATGDAVADFDQIGYEEVGGAFDVF